MSKIVVYRQLLGFIQNMKYFELNTMLWIVQAENPIVQVENLRLFVAGLSFKEKLSII